LRIIVDAAEFEPVTSSTAALIATGRAITTGWNLLKSGRTESEYKYLSGIVISPCCSVGNLKASGSEECHELGLSEVIDPPQLTTTQLFAHPAQDARPWLRALISHDASLKDALNKSDLHSQFA
jgi:hypothetical protein